MSAHDPWRTAAAMPRLRPRITAMMSDKSVGMSVGSARSQMAWVTGRRKKID
jgi:hypothetical protein